jgi:sirohydrochlorin cobaltochelatase
MTVPIVLVAYGTSSRAFEAYKFLDRIFRGRFSGHEIYWAFSSRAVTKKIHQQFGIKPNRLSEVLSTIQMKGWSSVVVQSMHLLCAGEFHRVRTELKNNSLKYSIGLPLLSKLRDYIEVSDAFSDLIQRPPGEAVVLVGHGTDHPAWTTFPALQSILRRKLGAGIYVGVLERGYPNRDMILDEIKQSGFQRVRLIPFLLVAGVHVLRDLVGEKDSWKAAFEAENLEIIAEKRGIAENPKIVEIFCRHISEALKTIEF